MSERTPLNLMTSDAGGRHAGELLRRAREAQGLTLDHLASQIKVSSIKLEALEQGRYDSLGDSNFTRALAMTVCRTLRIDATEVMACLPAARLHALSQSKSSINEPFRDRDSVPALFDRGHRLNLKTLLTSKWLAPLILLGAAALIYALPESIEWPSWSRDLGVKVEPTPSPVDEDAALQPSSMQVAADQAEKLDSAEAASAASASAISATPGTPSLDVGTDLTAASVASSSAMAASGVTSAIVAPSIPAPVSATTPVLGVAPVRIVVNENSWIEVVDGLGVKVFSRIALAGEALELQGQPPFKLRIGNAAAVQVSFKGQPVSLGDFTRNNTARVELK